MRHPWLCAGLVCAALPLSAQIWRAKESDNYRPNRNDGRFDLRVRVNGPTECRIRWDTVECRVRGQGDRPLDAGSEMNSPVPRAALRGLRLDQRDGRSRMNIAEEPSRGNGWAIVVRIDDNFRRGDNGRHHARITWDGASGGGDWSDGGGNDGGWGSGPGGGSAPSWAVGRFTARPRGGGREIEVEINRRGEIRGVNSDRWRGDIDGRRMRLAGESYEIERDRDGFRARSRRDGDVILFRRY